MGVFVTVLHVVVAVVARGGKGAVGHGENHLQVAVDREGVVNGFGDADAPLLALRVGASGYYLAAHLDKEILHALALEHEGYLVNGISLGYGRAVEHDAGVSLDYLPAHELHLVHAHDGAHTVNLDRGGEVALAETESPGVDQWCHGDVERSVGGVMHLTGKGEDADEVVVNLHISVLVYCGYDALLVEGRE